METQILEADQAVAEILEEVTSTSPVVVVESPHNLGVGNFEREMGKEIKLRGLELEKEKEKELAQEKEKEQIRSRELGMKKNKKS